jgi:hypothetical protein
MAVDFFPLLEEAQACKDPSHHRQPSDKVIVVRANGNGNGNVFGFTTVTDLKSGKTLSANRVRAFIRRNGNPA